MQNFVGAVQGWSLCFFQSYGSPTIKLCYFQGQIPWGSQVPLSGPQDGKVDVGFRTFITVGELLWCYCSPVCGSQIRGLILSWLCPSYCLTEASLSLDPRHLFLVNSSILLLMVVQQLQCWCFGRRRWVHVLLVHHLELEASKSSFKSFVVMNGDIENPGIWGWLDKLPLFPVSFNAWCCCPTLPCFPGGY